MFLPLKYKREKWSLPALCTKDEELVILMGEGRGLPEKSLKKVWIGWLILVGRRNMIGGCLRLTRDDRICDTQGSSIIRDCFLVSSVISNWAIDWLCMFWSGGCWRGVFNWDSEACSRIPISILFEGQQTSIPFPDHKDLFRPLSDGTTNMLCFVCWF